MAQDPAEIVQRLYATLDSNPTIRKSGEEALSQASGLPGALLPSVCPEARKLTKVLIFLELTPCIIKPGWHNSLPSY